MDALPVLSQVKSLYQVIRGDSNGARITQVNFSRQCPVISQFRFFVEVMILGDREAARNTQMECLGFLSAATDAIPVLGHVKGGIHYACGDRERGNKPVI